MVSLASFLEEVECWRVLMDGQKSGAEDKDAVPLREEPISQHCTWTRNSPSAPPKAEGSVLHSEGATKMQEICCSPGTFCLVEGQDIY